MDARRLRRQGATAASIAALSSPIMAAPAEGAVPHTVQPGETLWSIAAANNFTTRTIAAFNGLSEGSAVVAGQTIQIPTEGEGATALANAGLVGTPVSSGTAAGSAGSHTVVAGETLSGIAAANGLSASELAAANGLSADALVITGQTLQIPAGSGSSTSGPAASAPMAQPDPPVPPFYEGSTYGLGHIESPSGTLHLDAAAAESWNAMRQEAKNQYGIDIYPGGPLSAFRTSEQQAHLYDLYLSGQGAPANPPGTSSHETGIAVDLADPGMRTVVDNLGSGFGWAKVHGPTEWWHVDYVGGG
jgi:LysM repeat protein